MQKKKFNFRQIFILLLLIISGYIFYNVAIKNNSQEEQPTNEVYCLEEGKNKDEIIEVFKNAEGKTATLCVGDKKFGLYHILYGHSVDCNTENKDKDTLFPPKTTIKQITEGIKEVFTTGELELTNDKYIFTKKITLNGVKGMHLLVVGKNDKIVTFYRKNRQSD